MTTECPSVASILWLCREIQSRRARRERSHTLEVYCFTCRFPSRSDDILRGMTHLYKFNLKIWFYRILCVTRYLWNRLAARFLCSSSFGGEVPTGTRSKSCDNNVKQQSIKKRTASATRRTTATSSNLTRSLVKKQYHTHTKHPSRHSSLLS